MLKIDGRQKAIFLKIATLVKANKEICLFAGIALISLMIGVLKNPKPEAQPQHSPPPSFDTYIPEGHSLVPIDVANYETLDSLLGSFGVVDLFTQDLQNPQISRRIAHRVKIVRAPNNPSHFAILVPYDQVPHILKNSGPMMVSVLNPKARGTSFEKAVPQKRSRIVYNTGD